MRECVWSTAYPDFPARPAPKIAPILAVAGSFTPQMHHTAHSPQPNYSLRINGSISSSGSSQPSLKVTKPCHAPSKDFGCEDIRLLGDSIREVRKRTSSTFSSIGNVSAAASISINVLIRGKCPTLCGASNFPKQRRRLRLGRRPLLPDETESA